MFLPKVHALRPGFTSPSLPPGHRDVFLHDHAHFMFVYMHSRLRVKRVLDKGQFYSYT